MRTLLWEIEASIVGLLDRLLGRSQVSQRVTEPESSKSTPTLTVHLLGGEDDLEVVGESHYQPALWAICDSHQGERVRHRVTAVLVPEPSNPYDANAVRVDIESQTIGYLDRSDAATYTPGLLQLMSQHRGHIGLAGVIVGGGQRHDGPGYLGVWLEHDRRQFGLGTPTQRRPGLQDRPPTAMRTGFSEAWLTDLDDDSYDLSWYSRLPEADQPAIQELRALLATDPDPIDRHFQFGELERRLYRRRDFEEDALPAFDEICKQHDAEMAGIREELHAKFAKVPFLETYKQMAIRQQKVKNWAECEWWAARGLQLYGDDAADATWVDDLQKRLNRAQAKLDEPKGVRRKADGVVKIRASEGQSLPPPITAPTGIEVLTCVRCAIGFERLRVRGRKPTLCPVCRL